MRVCAVLCMVLLAAAAFGKQRGIWDARVLSMGRDAWGLYYTDHLAGRGASSTVTLCYADVIYGEVLERRNNRVMRTLPTARQRSLRRLRNLVEDMSIDCVSCAQNLMGVGFLWPYQMGASISADVEEAMAACLKAPPKHPVRVSPSDVEGILHEWATWMRRKEHAMKMGDKIAGDPQDALERLGVIRATFAKIVAICSKLPTNVSGPILGRCQKVAQQSAEYSSHWE